VLEVILTTDTNNIFIDSEIILNIGKKKSSLFKIPTMYFSVRYNLVHSKTSVKFVYFS
jgi:hypothetical protein